MKENVWLTATHIPGNDNTEADKKNQENSMTTLNGS